MKRICKVILAAAAIAALAVPAMAADKLMVKGTSGADGNVLRVDDTGITEVKAKFLPLTDAVEMAKPILGVYNNDVLRTKVRPLGIQEWYMNSGTGEAGQIAYSTPGGGVGFGLWHYDSVPQTFSKNKFTMVSNLDNGAGVPIFVLNYDSTATTWFGITPTGVSIGAGWVPRADLEVIGTLMINNTPADGGGSTVARPTCAANKDGGLYYTQGTAGVASKLELCQKAAGGTYSWVLVK